MTMRIKALVIAAAALLAAPAAAHASEGTLKQLPTPAANVNSVLEMALSPDSRQLYAVDGGLKVFDRDAASGALTQRAQCFRADGQDGCATAPGPTYARAVAVSPDGKSVYAGGDGGFAVFDRAADGSLKQKPGPEACFGGGTCQPAAGLDAVRSIAISLDGTTVYALSSHSLAVFDRQGDGSLVQKAGNNGCITGGPVAGCAQAVGLSGLRAIAVSPDGHNVYLGSTGFGMILTFNRAATGTLTASGCLSDAPFAGCTTGDRITNAYALAVSPDGRNVYSASWGPAASGIAVLDRDPATGALSQAPAPSIDGCAGNGNDPRCRQAVALDSVYDVAISGDGHSVYAATLEGIAVFDRVAGGDLVQKPLPDGCLLDRDFTVQIGCAPADHIIETRTIVVAPDGGSVYSATPWYQSIAAFARELPPAPAPTPTPSPSPSPAPSPAPASATQAPAAPQGTVVTSSTSSTKLIAKLRSRSFKAKRGKAFRVAYVSTIRGTATLQVLKGHKRVLTMKSSTGRAFRITKKLARGRYRIKLTMKAGGQKAGDSARLTVR